MSSNDENMVEREVKAFFYGSFVRKDVQLKAGFSPRSVEIACLNGFDIHIAPHAALSRSEGRAVYGILVGITHRHLEIMYSAPGVGVFLPEAVVVLTRDGKLSPALCYIPPAVGTEPADKDYLAKLIAAGREYGFPGWYLRHLEKMP
ncbi:hypothetical protein [Sphingomonas sp.]|uniref:hypothetical protein n=1 Tax=Sphingomonas sp. TaxID=28214 RepID=UPI0038AAA05D